MGRSDDTRSSGSSHGRDRKPAPPDEHRGCRATRWQKINAALGGGRLMVGVYALLGINNEDGPGGLL